MPKYANVGVILFVKLSPMRYAICVAAGVMPAIKSMGTKTVESTAHFALILLTKRFMIAIRNTKAIKRPTP